MIPANFHLLFRVCMIGSLLGAVATSYFLAGWAGLVGRVLIDIAAASAAAAAAVYFLYAFFRALPRGSPLGAILWAAGFGVVSVAALLGLVPPTARDELTQHLLMPRLYHEAGKIIALPFAPYSYYPMLLDMLYVPWVGWGWDSAPKLVHGLYGALTGLLVYAYLAARLNAIYGLLGLLIFVSTPAVFRLSHWAYVDLGVTFYATAALLCLVSGAREDKRWLLVGGLSAGFALASKPNGLLVLLMLGFLWVFAPADADRAGPGKTAARAGIFFTMAAAAISPWWIRNWMWAGNPLYPFFLNLFGGAVEGGGEGPGLGIFGRRVFLYGESWWQISLLPLRIFFTGQDDQPRFFDGVLNPMLILFLPWAFKGKWSADKRLLFAFAALYLAFAVLLVETRIRYVFPIVPPLAVLAVYGIHNMYLRIRRPWVLFTIAGALFIPNGVYIWRDVERVSAIEYLRGQVSREGYLERQMPDYAVFRYANQRLPRDAKIYLLFMGRRAYYCRREYVHDPGDMPWMLMRMVRGAASGEQLKAQLRDRGITHLVIRDELFARFTANNLDAQQIGVWNAFARHHLGGLFNARGYSLFEIHG